jgi:hypothetical protein
MLPFDNKPWAKRLAAVVISLSVLAAVLGAWYLHSIDQLYIPEVTGILLLLLTIIPPNIAVLRKKPPSADGSPNLSSQANPSGHAPEPTTLLNPARLHPR